MAHPSGPSSPIKRKRTAQAPPTDVESTEDGPAPAHVFQCGDCRRVISDTTFLAAIAESNHSLCFRAVSCPDTKTAEISVKASDPRTGDLAGSKYRLVTCECGKLLGRFYSAAPIEIAHLRGLYQLSAEALTSYELGALKEPVKAASEHGQEPMLNCVYYTILALYERMMRLEASQNALVSAQSSSSAGPSAPSAEVHALRAALKRQQQQMLEMQAAVKALGGALPESSTSGSHGANQKRNRTS